MLFKTWLFSAVMLRLEVLHYLGWLPACQDIGDDRGALAPARIRGKAWLLVLSLTTHAPVLCKTCDHHHRRQQQHAHSQREVQEYAKTEMSSPSAPDGPSPPTGRRLSRWSRRNVSSSFDQEYNRYD
jgi:hypothetical protein